MKLTITLVGSVSRMYLNQTIMFVRCPVKVDALMQAANICGSATYYLAITMYV